MQIRYLFSAFLIGAAITALASSTDVKRYELPVGDFSELKVIDGINVDWRCNPDSTGYAVFTSTHERASVLMFEPRKNSLKVQLIASDAPIADIPTVTVYSSQLTKIENDGDSLVRVFTPVAPDKLQIKVVGNGRVAAHGISTTDLKAMIMTGRGQIAIDGQAVNATYSVTGTGTIQADNLQARDVSCRIVGTGDIGCYATGRLSVHGVGSGHVYYSGDPEVSSNSLGNKIVKNE